MDILLHLGLGLLGIALVLLIKIAKYKNSVETFRDVFKIYLFSIIWSVVALILMVVLIKLVPDFTNVLQFIGANIELPNGQINESSFVLLGATLFYFVNDSQGKKNDSE